MHLEHCHALETGVESDCNCSFTHVGVYDRNEATGHGLGMPDPLALLPGEPDRHEVLETFMGWICDGIARLDIYEDTDPSDIPWPDFGDSCIEVRYKGFIYRLRLDAVEVEK